MRVLLLTAFLFTALLFACSKEKGVAKNLPVYNDDEPPTINVNSPLNEPRLRVGETLVVKINVVDNRHVAEISWEAMNAASVCGNTPYKGEINPQQQSFDMTINFLIPPNFTGNRFIRFIAMDNYGNSTSRDVNFTIID